MVNNIKIRLLTPDDSLEELTHLIHIAYRQLADMGFRYWGTHQSVQDTKDRIAKGECYVVEHSQTIIGTVVLNFSNNSSHHPWYDRPDVTSFHQFAVNPAFQGQGIGSMMMDTIENRAKELRVKELACDTAEHAFHLIHMYEKRGYRKVDEADWDGTNYRSVILSKSL